MSQEQKEKKESDDWITIVLEKSVVNNPILEWFGWEKAIKGKRAIPFYSQPNRAFFEGKVKNKQLVQVYLQIPTGITLQYQDRQWAEETNVKIQLPFEMAEKIAQDILKTVKRYRTPKTGKRKVEEAT